MKWYLLILSVIAAGATSTPALSQQNAGHEPLTSADTAFALAAYRRGLGQIQLGRLAATRASNDGVRGSGALLVRQYIANTRRLRQIMARYHIAPPTMPDAADRSAASRLSSFNGRTFDTAFLRTQYMDDLRLDGLYDREAVHGANPDLSLFAADNLRVVRRDAVLARRLGGNAMYASFHRNHATGVPFPHAPGARE